MTRAYGENSRSAIVRYLFPFQDTSSPLLHRRPVSLAAHAILRTPTITVLARPQFVEPAHLPVQWVGDATDGERLAEFAGRLCSMSQHNPAGRSTRDYLENIKQQGHGSVLEHASYSLLFEGVSRSLTHELVRHRAGFSYSQLSQRHVDERDACFVMPPAIIGDAALETAWTTQMTAALASYGTLVDALMARYGWVGDKIQRRKMAREAARGVLPNSTETKIVCTGNARAWHAMLALRAGESAELEMRRLAVATVQVLQMEAPGLFSDFEIYVASDRREAARAGFPRV
jgi:thymidylate synthase (FAD)